MVDVITNNLDLWTTAQKNKKAVGRGVSNKQEAHGIKKLHELILELAVRGKLVPQEPNDEPASVLLEKIADEKSQLIKEGVIKKQKPLPEVSEDEKLFGLPNGWEWGRLSMIGNIFNGNSISVRVKEEKYTYIDGGTPFIATKDVGYGWSELGYDNGVSIPLNEPKFKMAHKGAVLICSEGGSAGKKCGIAIKDIYFGNKLFANELYGNVEPSYILSFYLTPTFYQQFSSKMTGIIGGISTSKFCQLIVPIPPLEEQCRIVAKVDELMALCNQLEQQQTDNIAAHQTLVEILLGALASVEAQEEFAETWNRIVNHFDKLFTTEQSIDLLKQTVINLVIQGKLLGFFSNAKQYSVKDLLSFGPRNGLSPKEVAYETDIRVFKLGATTKGILDTTQSKYVDIDVKKDSHLWVSKGDILVQRGNAKQYVGCSVLVTENINHYIYPDLMMKLCANELVRAAYLTLCLSSLSSREYMWERMTGTSGTMPKISKRVVESIPLLIPSIQEQDAILVFAEKLETLINNLKKCLRDAQTTKTKLADAVVEQVVV